MFQVLNPVPRHFLDAIRRGGRRDPRIDEDIDAARLHEIEERAHRAVVDVLPQLFDEDDDFIRELAAELRRDDRQTRWT